MHAALEHALRGELELLVRQPAVGGRRGVLARRPPLVVVKPAPTPRRVVGVADYDRHTIELVLSPSTTHRELLATLAHEVVHIFGCERHDGEFKKTLARLSYEAWGLDVSNAVRRSYGALDLAIEDSPTLRWRGFVLWAGVLRRRAWAWT